MNIKLNFLTLFALTILLQVSCGQTSRADLVGIDGGGEVNEMFLDWLRSHESEEIELTEAEVVELLSNATSIDCSKYVLSDKLKNRLPVEKCIKFLKVGEQTIPNDFEWIRSMQQLEGLSLAVSKLEEADLSMLEPLENLKWLDLSYCSLPENQGDVPLVVKTESRSHI
jgi:Leucine-rich repeat (LRR) protein